MTIDQKITVDFFDFVTLDLQKDTALSLLMANTTANNIVTLAYTFTTPTADTASTVIAYPPFTIDELQIEEAYVVYSSETGAQPIAGEPRALFLINAGLTLIPDTLTGGTIIFVEQNAIGQVLKRTTFELKQPLDDAEQQVLYEQNYLGLLQNARLEAVRTDGIATISLPSGQSESYRSIASLDNQIEIVIHRIEMIKRAQAGRLPLGGMEIN